MAHNEIWARAYEIWKKYRDLPPGERASFLDAECGAVQELRQMVLDLDANYRETAALSAELMEEKRPRQSPLLRPDSELGPYRVLKLLGEGGMGQVYLCLRMEEPDYRVDAVKILPQERVTDDAIARIGRESSRLQVLGQHPYFPEYRDHHVSIQGTSYLAMEYVHGQPIDEYCEREDLSFESRLELFVEVCRGVGFAHGENDPNREIRILHRDLTPANILVDDQGKPKILDLGISKVLAEGGGSKTLTAALERPHYTPNYASPEQIEGSWLTVPSDVYSLGAVLYKLITGRVPIDMTKVANNYDALLAKIKREEPPKPSRVTSEKWKKRVQGDLDLIIAKALAKDPRDRYRSAGDLSDDVARFLDGGAIKAEKPTLGYRAEKAIRKYRIGITVTAILLVASAVFSYFSYRQYQATKLAQSQTEAALNRSENVTDFIIGIFSSASPDQALGEELKVPELIEASREELDRKLQESPIERAAIMHALGRLYMELGRYPEAEKMFEEALQLRQRHLNPDHLDIGQTHHYFGFLLARFGKLEDSEKHLRTALDVWEVTNAPADDMAATCAILAKVLQIQNRHEDSLAYAEKAVNLYEQSLGREHIEYAAALDTVATVHQHRGDYKIAEPLMREAVEIASQVLDPRHPDLAGLQSNLGLLLHYMTQYEEAKHWLLESLEAKEELFGPTHPTTIVTLSNLGLVYAELGEMEAAEQAKKQVLSSLEEAVGREHRHFAVSLHNLADFYRKENRNEEAEPLLREAIATKRQVIGADHPSVANSLNSLAGLLTDTDRSSEAIPIYQEALTIYETSLGDSHPHYLKALHNLSKAYRKLGQFTKARELAAEVITKVESTLGSDHAQYGAATQNLGEIALLQGKIEEAEEYFRSSLTNREVVYGAEHSRLLNPLEKLVEVLLSTGREKEAEEYQARIAAISAESE